jgi:GNAT superfamily N-acetyltransferase
LNESTEDRTPFAGVPPGEGTPARNLRFRPMRREDKPAVLALARRIWEGSDYLPRVFDAWVDGPGYFAAAFLEETFVGCGRLMPFDRRRAWLEGLRVSPEFQGRGLGREMSLHLFRTGKTRGFEELLFSTYFSNTSSIRISEQAGFHRIGVYSQLECDPGAVGAVALPEGCDIVPGLPRERFPMWNDWLYVPPDAPGLESYLPGALTVSRDGCTLVLADNLKSPHEYLEISLARGVEGPEGDAVLRFAVRRAQELGRRFLHLMIPEDAPLAPWRAFGFKSFERERDVFLYRGKVSDLAI